MRSSRVRFSDGPTVEYQTWYPQSLVIRKNPTSQYNNNNFEEGGLMFHEKRNTRKVCVNFVPSDKDERCHGCRYYEHEHVSYSNYKSWSRTSNWRSELHLDSIDYGQKGINKKIRFISQVDNIDKLADFTIIANDTHPKVVLDHLVRDWKLNLPNICISVAGSTKNVNIIPRHMNRLKNGLLKAVCSTSCWVLTSGTAQGVDNIACDALREAQYLAWMGTGAPSFQILGLLNWNCTSQHQDIGKHVWNNNPEPFPYNILTKTTCPDTGEHYPTMNPLVSHFIGIESGVQSLKSGEVFVRSSFEEMLSADPGTSKHYRNLGLNTPTVLVLIGGEFDVFERAANAVEKDIPIVLCEGSGHATDILATAIRLSNKNKSLRLTREQEYAIVGIMENLLSKKKEKGTLFPESMFEGSRHLPFVRKCVRYRKLVFFYRVTMSVSHLDIAILRALLSSNPARRKDPVELAVHWNRCDEVVREIVEGWSDINARSNIKLLVTKALMEDKVDFIELFLEYNFDMKRYLTTNMLAHLYESACAEYPPLVKLLKRAKRGNGAESFKLKHVYNLIQSTTSARPSHDLVDIPGGNGYKSFDDPFRELCFWAILTNKMTMCEFFWTKCKNPVIMALIASRLWSVHKSAVAAQDEDTKQEMERNSDEFTQLALEVLDQAWEVNQGMADDLITYKYRGFDRVSIMDLAAFIEAKEFIARPVVQVKIESLWKGGLRGSLLQVLVAFLMPINIKRLHHEKDDIEQDSLDHFMQEDEETQRRLEMKRAERRAEEQYRATTLQEEKKKLYGALNTADRFATASIVLQNIQRRMEAIRMKSAQQQAAGQEWAGAEGAGGEDEAPSDAEESEQGSDMDEDKEMMDNLEDTLLPGPKEHNEDDNQYQVKILEDNEEDFGKSQDALSFSSKSREKMAASASRDTLESKEGEEEAPAAACEKRRSRTDSSGEKMNADHILHQLRAMDKSRHVTSSSQGDFDHASRRSSQQSRAGAEKVDLELEKLRHLPFYQIALIYYSAPVTKFCMHTIAYLTFLVIFTKSTMETGMGMRSVWGMLSFQFMICYALEAYRQLVTQRAAWKMKLKIWAMSEWNIIELTYLSMGLISFPLTAWEETRMTAITINCFIVVLMWIRLLRFYQCSSKLGPMWIMIRKMMAETMYFMAIFGILVISCGICIFSINVNYKEDRTEYWQEDSYIFIRPYLMFLGNQFLEWTYSGRNPRLTVITCFFFVVVGNALMLNLLVAIYGGIFNEIIDKSDQEWKTEMYWLMKDFTSKTFLPPPISIFETILSWGYYICWGRKKTAPALDKREQELIETLEVLESYCVDNVMRTREQTRDSIDITSNTIRNREVTCGKLVETIETVEDLRREVENKKIIEAEKKREEFRKQLLK